MHINILERIFIKISKRTINFAICVCTYINFSPVEIYSLMLLPFLIHNPNSCIHSNLHISFKFSTKQEISMCLCVFGLAPDQKVHSLPEVRKLNSLSFPKCGTNPS